MKDKRHRSPFPQLVQVLLLQFLLQFWSTSGQVLEKKAVAGLYYEEIPSASTFYQSVAPIVFQFRVPKWSKTEILIPSGSNCTSPEWSEGSTCPVRFYLPEMQSRFSAYLFDAQPLVNSFEFMNASPQMSEIQFECDILSKHFQDIYISTPVLDRYLRKLKSCSPAGDTEFTQNLSNYKYNISEIYLKMRQGFFSEVWMKVHDGRVDAGLWSNALNVLNSLTFTNYYMEANRWKLGLADCQNGRIPSTLLTPDLMADTLQDLFENLNKTGLQAVISSADIGNYYQAPIADCTFTNDNTFVLRILIPVIQSRSSYSLIKLTSAQFWKDDSEICQIQLSTSSSSSSYVILDNMIKQNKVAYDTDCRPNELCHVSTLKSTRRVNACASAFLNGHFWNLIKYCKLSCEPISPYHLNDVGGLHSVFIQNVNSDKFLITGLYNPGEKEKNNYTVKFKEEYLIPVIRCPGSPDFKVNVVSLGAVEITLPCQCSLVHKSIIYYPKRPCNENSNSKAVLAQVVPFHWIGDHKLDELRVSKGHTQEPLALAFSDDDIELREDYYSSGGKAGSSTTTGTKFLLVIYFLLILIILMMLLFLMHRLHSMGISINPWKVIKTSQQISYRNVVHDNGLLYNENEQ